MEINIRILKDSYKIKIDPNWLIAISNLLVAVSNFFVAFFH